MGPGRDLDVHTARHVTDPGLVIIVEDRHESILVYTGPQIRIGN